MEEATPKKSRKWVIRTAIIFFVIMGLLVFFSQTIMNYSLPKVSAQYPGYGTIATSNRASSLIEAVSKIDVKAFDNRTVQAVYVYEYYEVQAGDVLMTLEPVTDSTELDTLKEQLEQILLNRYYNDKLPDNSPDYTSYQNAIDDAQAALDQANLDLTNAKNKATIISSAQAAADAATAAIISLEAEIEALSETKTDLEIELSEAQAALAAVPDGDDNTWEQSEVDRITSELATADSQLDSKSVALASEQTKLATAEAKLAEANSYLTVTDAEKYVTRAKKSLQDSKDALSDQKKIDGVESEKEKKARDDEDKLIADLEKEITELETLNAVTEITAPISGLPTGFSFYPGEQISKDQILGTITDPMGGFKASFTFTTAEAQSIYVGMDFGVNQYQADRVTVTQIRPDPSNPSGSRIVTTSVQGEYLWAGSEIQVWFDDFNRQYECLVPNSAIHEDNEGKFVYVLKTKDSPLGERYTAVKVSVTILATDGKSSALDPSVVGGQYIITRSDEPLENGEQVRLENYQQEV